MEMKLFDNEHYKVLMSEEYNYTFNKDNGRFFRWGKTKEDNPSYSPFGPEILDLEISKGSCLGNCDFCYKCNGFDNNSVNLSFANFKKIFDKMPKILTQIAFILENGKEITVKSNKKIKLVNGNYKLAKDIIENDDIDENQFF